MAAVEALRNVFPAGLSIARFLGYLQPLGLQLHLHRLR